MTCPMCGSEKSILPDWERMQNFAFGTSVAPGTSYMRQEPISSATLEGNVAVPFLQSVISGVFAGIAAGGIAAIVEQPKSAIIGLITTSVTSGLVWAIALQWHNRLLWTIEEITGADIDQDGAVGPPRQTPIDEVDERYDNGTPKLVKLDWLPIAPEETQKLAIAVVVSGVRFVRDDLVRAEAIKFNDYGKVMKVLLNRNYLRKSGNGVVVTYAGYRWLCKQIPTGMTPLPYTSLQ